jgi:hypothetical protein
VVLACWKWRSENRPEPVSLYKGYMISKKQICCWYNELWHRALCCCTTQPSEGLQCSRWERRQFTLQSDFRISDLRFFGPLKQMLSGRQFDPDSDESILNGSVMSFSAVDGCRRFGRTYSLHIQDM